MKTSYTIQRGLLDGIEPFLRVAARKSFRAAADDRVAHEQARGRQPALAKVDEGRYNRDTRGASHEQSRIFATKV